MLAAKPLDVNSSSCSLGFPLARLCCIKSRPQSCTSLQLTRGMARSTGAHHVPFISGDVTMAGHRRFPPHPEPNQIPVLPTIKRMLYLQTLYPGRIETFGGRWPGAQVFGGRPSCGRPSCGSHPCTTRTRPSLATTSYPTRTP